MKNKNNSSQKSDPKREFYFANTYPSDEIKSQNMQRNVIFDLKPFSAYITASIDHIKQSTAKGADVVDVSKEQQKYLIPQFSLIKPQISGLTFFVEKPKNIFALTSDDDFDSESFEVYGRQEKICSFEDKIDVYNGITFVKIENSSQNFCDKKFDLYDDDSHKDESIKCQISEIDFENINSYRISGIKVESCSVCDDKNLEIKTNSDISNLNEIEIFGKECKILKKEPAANTKITAQNFQVSKFNDDFYLVVPAIQKNKKVEFLSGNKKIKYQEILLNELDESKLQNMLGTKEVFVVNSRLMYRGG